MALVMTISSVFGNAFVVYADTNPDAGKVTAVKTAERIGDETSRSAKVKITVSGNPYTLTTQKDREIILVLDASGSMTEGIRGSEKNKIQTLKESANSFIDNLLTEENAGKIKIGIVWYSKSIDSFCNLSSDANSLKNCVADGYANGGTNIQIGIKKAKELFSVSDNEKSLIVLSDGEPTYYSDSKGTIHGAGDSDSHEWVFSDRFVSTKTYNNSLGQRVSDGYIDYYDEKSREPYRCEYIGYYVSRGQVHYESRTCPDGFGLKPSEAAKNEVSSFSGKVYTIGFGVGDNSTAENFLKSIIKNGGSYFSASDATKLNDAFAAVSKDIEIVAKDLTITDVVPNTFDVDIDALKENYGDTVTISYDDAGQTIITYRFDELSSKEAEELTFTVTAKDNYYGSMYTNNGATVTGTASDGNKFYENVNGKIEENLLDPVAPIASRTSADKYETKTNEELVVDKDNGIKSNDYDGKQENNVESVLDEIIIVNNTKYGSLELNQDGSLKYNPNNNFRGSDSFSYYIKTTITDKNGNKTYAKSNTSNVSINVKGVVTSYVVNYLEKGTNKVVAPSKTVTKNSNNEDLYVGDNVTESALSLNNYNLVGDGSASITLAKEGNVINFYYELKDSKIVVRYLEKDTDTKLAADDTFDGKVTDKKVISAKDIKDYVVVGSKTQNAEFGLVTNEYTFYYEKAESAGAVAYHYIIDNKGNKTINKLFKDDVVNGKVGDAFSFSPKSENLGDYEFVESVGVTSGKLSSEKQEVIFYYQLKKTNVTVRYVTIVNGDLVDLITPVKDSGRINDNYTAYAKTFVNYNLDGKDEQTIKLVNGENVIVFIYTLKDGKVIVHHYEEGTTIKIADDEVINGKVGKDYNTKEVDVLGYSLVSVPDNASGKFTDEEIEVVYYYKKDMGKVITKYVDEDGKVLLDETTTSGQVGTDYITSPAVISDYELVNTIGNDKGKYTKEDIIVTYVYQYVMGEGGDDTPDIPYTGIENDSYILEYSLMGTSALGLILLAILKKKFN